MAVTVPSVRPYGTWPPPIAATGIAEAGVLSWLQIHRLPA